MAKGHRPTRAELASTCEDLLRRMDQIDNLMTALKGQAELATTACGWRASKANWTVLQGQVHLMAETARQIAHLTVAKSWLSPELPER